MEGRRNIPRIVFVYMLCCVCTCVHVFFPIPVMRLTSRCFYYGQVTSWLLGFCSKQVTIILQDPNETSDLIRWLSRYTGLVVVYLTGL